MAQDRTPTDADAATPQHPAVPAAMPRPGALGWLGRALLWLPGTLLGMALAGLLVGGLWAASDGSLGQGLRWAHSWQAEHAPEAGRIELGEVDGSLLRGGHIDRLAWAQNGLDVQAENVELRLGTRFWLGLLGGRIDVASLQLGALRINDQRAPDTASDTAPPASLELPLPIEVTLGVGSLQVAGAASLQASDLQAHYRYGRAEADLGTADAHTLTLHSLQWADGRYQAQLALGAQAPMPLRLQLRGELQAQVPDGEALTLRARATAQGQLAGADAVLDLGAQIEPVASNDATPTLAATARVRPWANQPLSTVDARLHRLDLAMLWPQAPRSAFTGTISAQPDGADWLAKVQLQNERPGPIDQQSLPLKNLALDLRQSGDTWTLSALDAEVAGGRLRGQGQARWPVDNAPAGAAASTRTWQGELRFSGLDPQQLWQSLAPAALDGSLSARSAATPGQPGDIAFDARIAPAGRQPQRSAADAWRLREVALQGRWSPGTGSATQGVLTLQRAHVDAFDSQLDAQGVFDTQRTVAQGELALSVPGLTARWQGRAAATDGQGDARLDVADGERTLAWLRALQNAPLIGEAVRSQLAPWAALQLKARGDARLTWQGGLVALGWPGQTAPAPRLTLAARVQQLQLQSDDAQAPLDLRLSNTALDLKGSPDALTWGLSGQLAQAGRQFDLDSAGGLGIGGPPLQARSGQLLVERLRLDVSTGEDTIRWRLSNGAPWRASWQRRANGVDVAADAGSLRLQPQRGNTDAQSAALTWDALSWQAGALLTRGRLTGLPLAWVDQLARNEGGDSPGPLARAGLGGDMVFDGEWDFALPAQSSQPPRLNLTIAQRSGDLAVQTDGAFDDNANRSQRVQAGVKTARLVVRTEGSRVQADLQWDSERFGNATLQASTALSPPNATHAAWHWAEQAPISARAQASLPQVGVWSVLAPPGWRIRGALRLEAAVSGTRDNPQVSGTLQADDLALRSLVNGISFRGGELRATLAGERVVIERFRLEGRGGAERGGVLTATGSAEWRRVQRDGQTRREPLIELQAKAEKLRASSRADRRLTVSGEVRARLEGAALQLRGQLRADEALIVLPDELAPSLGDDVVVRGTEFPIERGGGVRVVPDVQLTLDLGNNFELRGQGLQTRLAGQLEVKSLPDAPAPRVVGEVRTVSGSYRAYGQQLGIETGVLRFSGAYDNPALDITAVRPNSSQRVGVQVSGTAQAPRVRLFSDPDMPDSEKLAWLVLGRPASGTGAEAAVLQQAAIALIAGNGGGPLDGGLASALGLDTLSLASDGTNADGSSNTALTLGKRLADDLYISYERSLAGTLNTVSMFYDVTRNLTVRGRAGSENALDLIFTFRYD
ncbi:MAG: translocation/assembly module TamB domain-containing protein [Hydrogenophaga sp.]|uniref:translocation/assembly module TamB domain-containing protein n=1 Tax=Hydrogenophaga sp. TaxID=1904254 RepID=UPI001DA221DF|nr:translocation/assembly module TamB domain-containing protein [Hydrogenophaga sp.]MBX3610142.1 translocation/assembly module TamB domain-containing protein [Hydrogenophaga sp.]